MIMMHSRLIAILFLTTLLRNTLVFGVNNPVGSVTNNEKCILEFEFYCDHYITDHLLQQQLSRCFPDSTLHIDQTTLNQLVLNHEALYRDVQTINDYPAIRLMINLAAIYAYHGFYNLAYSAAVKVIQQPTENIHSLFLANQLAYISSFKTTRYEESVKHLRNIIQMASDQSEAELLVHALSQLSYVYYKLDDLPKAQLFYSTMQAEAKRHDNQSLMLVALGIALSNQENSHPDEVQLSSLSPDVLAGSNRISELSFYLITKYRTAIDNSGKDLIFDLIQKLASANNLNGLRIEAGKMYMRYNLEDKPDETFNVFLEVALLLKTETTSLLNKKEDIMNAVSIRNADYSNKTTTGTKLLFGNRLSFTIIFGVSMLISFILILGISKTKEKYNKQQSEVNSSINELTVHVKTMDSDIDQRVSEYNHVMMHELKEREKVDAELKHALKRAEDANYLKNSFLSSMSHEIRTPLNGIMGFSNLLQQEMAELENTELYEYAHSIERSGERLLHLLNNIIDISRVEANDLPMNIKPVDLEQIINQVVEIFSFRANEKGIRIVRDGKPDQPILADKDTLMRVILEVMDNSMKFTEKGFIKIECSSDLEKKIQFIVIKDTGIGIDESYIPHIFDAFRQESFGYTRQYQGAGLGMPLAQRMMLLMNGSIAVNSVKSIGTTVTLAIPWADQKERTIPSEEKKSHLKQKESQQQRFLVVEDDHSSRLIIAKMLKNHGIVEVTCDGDTAMKTLAARKADNMIFNIIFLDINLPAPWDGIRLKDQIIKQFPEYENIPFIAQTAYAMAGDKDKYLHAGFSKYISKPIEKKQLEKILDELSFA